ncbi:MAG: PAS domain-containing sensor histidine kinase, partial [Bacteroidales bacterium]|nr:PAS domain-containing sensor histidine kinase [Bacteroidales bacterium]
IKDKQIIGRTTSNAIISEETSLKIAESYKQSKQVKGLEIIFNNSNEQTKYISLYLHHTKLNGEEFNFLAFEDITEKKLFNTLLKESEENYRNLVDSAPFGIVILSTYEILYTNQLALDLIGLNSNDTIIGQSFIDIIHKDSAKIVKKLVSKLKDLGASAHLIEERFIRNNGDIIWLECIVKLIKYSGKPAVMLFFRDISERVHLLNSIRERDEKIRLIYESSIDAIIQTNDEGNIILFNKAAEALFQYKLDEVIYKNILILINENESLHKSIVKQFFNNLIYHHIKGGARGEQTFRRKDGSSFTGEISLYTGHTENGMLINASIKDITEIKQDKLQLEESERNYRLLVETMNDGVIRTDIDYKIQFANYHAAEILGYSIEELIGKNGYEILYYQEEIDFVKNKNKLYNFSDNYEIKLKKKDGNSIWVLISGAPVYNSINVTCGYIAVFSDITLKKNTEIELRHHQQFLEQIIENIPISLSVKDAKTGAFKIWNKTAEKIFGIPKSEAIGKTDYDFFKKEQADFFRQKDLEVFKQTEPVEIKEQIIDSASKGTITTHTIKVPLYNENGLPDSVIVFSEDITESKKDEHEREKLYEDLFLSKRILEENSQNIMKLNEELCESEKMLKESLKAKDKFFGIIAHDLRSPLTGFLQLTKLLTDEINNITISELNEISKTIYLSAYKLYKLLENLLEWSFVQQDQIKYIPKEINLLETIKDVFQYFDQLAKDKNISIETNIAPELNIFADANMFETIMRNLISNAIKFSYEGGKIIINCDIYEEEPDKYLISVKDFGIGISRDFIPHLFKIDKKLQRTGTKGEDGSGLGLILTKEFVARNGGKIWAESNT